MSKKNILFSALSVLLSFIFVFTLLAQEAPANQSSPAGPSALCYVLHMPMIIGGGAASSDISARELKDDFTNTPGAPNSCHDSGPTPDFNGDGYADLAVGVPDESVLMGVTYDKAGAVQVIYGTEDGLNALSGQAPVDDQIFARSVSGLDDIAIDDDDTLGSALATGDFNNDGYTDLAMGVPGSFAGGNDGAGAVQVVYGSPNGLLVDGNQTWSQDGSGIDGVPETGDNFGAALAAGDFNDDGYDDLAVGVPREDVLNANDDAGAVNVIYGSDEGLTDAGDDIITQNVVGFNGSGPEQDDEFGTALESGDFNGDGIADLAVGTPFEGNGPGFDNAGSVQIFFGKSESGLVHPTSGAYFPQHIIPSDPGIDNAMEPNDNFGRSLAAADFNKDGYTDLAVGTPYETHGAGGGAIPFAGAVNVLYGAESGLDTTLGAPIFHQGLTGMDSDPEANEYFGWSLAAADFDNDGYADLAVGVPGDKVFGIAIGSVHTLKGSANGVSTDFDERIFDGANPELSDGFGWAVTAADFNGDGHTDLGTGAPQDDPADVPDDNVGSVFINYSDADGISQPDYQNFYQSHNGLAGAPEPNDAFGKVLP